MNMLQLFTLVLGLAMIVVLIYLVVQGEPIPPALRMVVLIGVALMFVLCLTHTMGCPVVPLPQR